MSRDIPVKNQQPSIPMPSPQELKEEFSPSKSAQAFIAEARETINHILHGRDPRLLLIIGPCSIHNISEAKEYAHKLKRLESDIKDVFFPVMRVHFEKPRTTTGWKGILLDPHLDGSHNIQTGMRWTRELFIDLAELQIPTASELLSPTSAYYFSDLISWGCIGSRTAESQTHREMASGLPMPVAFKNNTDGNVLVAINGVLAASYPHTFIGMDERGKAAVEQTRGNPNCHIVLRGGRKLTNYDPKSISDALDALAAANLPKQLIIDCSHDNARKEYQKQIIVFKSVIKQAIEGNRHIRGVILESNLMEGRQEILPDAGQLKYGVSLTDSCLDWDFTEKLLRWGAKMVKETCDNSDEELFSTIHAANTISH